MHTDSILPKLHDADSRWKEYGRSEKPITDGSRPAAEGISDQADGDPDRRHSEARLSRLRFR